MSAYLKDYLKDLGDLGEYKVHFAIRSNDSSEPLDEFISNFDYWKSWNRYSSKKDHFNR